MSMAFGFVHGEVDEFLVRDSRDFDGTVLLSSHLLRVLVVNLTAAATVAAATST